MPAFTLFAAAAAAVVRAVPTQCPRKRGCVSWFPPLEQPSNLWKVSLRLPVWVVLSRVYGTTTTSLTATTHQAQVGIQLFDIIVVEALCFNSGSPKTGRLILCYSSSTIIFLAVPNSCRWDHG